MSPNVVIARRRSMVSVLERYLAVPGEVWECGVHQGVNAEAMAVAIRSGPIPHRLRLFDTFTGRPPETPEDALCLNAKFDQTSVATVADRLQRFEFVHLHPGVIPETFAGLKHVSIAFAYVDLDLYAGIAASVKYILPRLAVGGAILVDDYHKPEWPGVTAALEARPELQIHEEPYWALFERRAA